VAVNIFAPREVGNVDLDGRALGAYADLSITAQRDGPDVARRNPVALDQIHNARAKLLKVEGNLHPVDLRRVKKALHVLR